MSAIDIEPRLIRDENGNVAVIFALTTLVSLGLTGIAVDYGRAINARASLQGAVDAAALAGVRERTMSAQQRQQIVASVFQANLSAATAGAVPNITATASSVSIDASLPVSTTISSFFGQKSFTVLAESSASTASGKQLELSMMIDLTGSMGAYRGGKTKIEYLKDAASDMLAILFPNGDTSSDAVRVAIAPFADYVNAGQWADEATGLAPTGGAFANISNLNKTKQGKISPVKYTGVTGNSSGNQCGATSPSGILNASLVSAPQSQNAAGSVFSNDYCAQPNQNVAANYHEKSNTDLTKTGQWVPNDYYYPYTGNAPPGFVKASSNDRVWDIDRYNSGNWQWSTGSASSSGYFVPMLDDDTGLTIQRRTANYCTDWDDGRCRSWLYNLSGRVGYRVRVSGSAPTGVVLKAWNDPDAAGDGGYWNITGIRRSGNTYAFSFEWRTDGYYLPVYEALSGVQVVAGCESSVVAQPTSKLISCVTERTGSQAYTDASPSTSTVQPYNHGDTGIDNYSSDGICWVAGRELPSIIPLTNQKQPLTDFFANAKVGGATPGHIGTAWAWYMLSPKWSSVFSGSSAPTAYNTANVMKVAVLMTDGEYNIHYASATARTQALELCTNMKNAGITVYTIGFGFSTSSRAGDGSAEGNAKQLLQLCASGNSKYFFPYDGAQLRSDFQNIGSELMGTMQSNTSKLVN